MKKIFYFIASAIVALGAVACQNDIDETIDNNQQTEGYSIKVTIDEQTRVDLGEADADNKRKLTFTEGDVLVVRSGLQEGTNYLFEYAKAEGDVYTFTCNTEGVNSLVGTTPHIFYLGGLHESADALIPYGVGVCNTAAEKISGIGMYANATCHSSTFGDENNTVTLFAQPMLKFTANEPVTFSTKDETTFLFFVDGSWSKEYTTQTTGEIYLPILASNEQEIEVTVTTESGFHKTFKKVFVENKIYNLGAIEAPAAPAEKVYLIPNNNWKADNAWFAAYFFNAPASVQTRAAATDAWAKMTDEDANGVFECEIPAGFNSAIFCRMNPAFSDLAWDEMNGEEVVKDRVWNQTADLAIGVAPENYYYITGWDTGLWEAADYEVVAASIGIVGSFQGWDVAAPIAMTDNGDGWIVANGIELYKGDEFKFVEGNSWDVNYGNPEATLAAEVDTEYTLAQSGQNIKATKNGKFNIYFNTDSKAFKYTIAEEYTGLMVDITIDNKANWSPLNITLKHGENTIVENATVTNNKYAISGDYISESIEYILSSGSKSLEGSVTITKNGATITLEETVIKLTITLDTDNSKQWWGNTMKIHVWDTKTSFDTSWPGNNMTFEGNYTWSVIVPSELVGKTINYLVHNGNGWQSSDSTVTIKAEGNTVKGSAIGIN